MSVRANQVWLRLIEMFGDRMMREYGEDPPETWCMAIDRLEDRLISRALANLANDGLQHPPTLPQFVAAAKRLPPVRHLGVPSVQLLERQQADPKTREANLARLRALVRGATR